MIQAQIIGFWRGFSFENGQETAKLSIRLPGGLVVEVAVQPEYLHTLVDAAEEKSANSDEQEDNPEDICTAKTEPPAPQEAQTLDASEEELVDWVRMPEELLPTHVKRALLADGVPPRIPVSRVLQLRDKMLALCAESHAAAVAGASRPSVEWSTGSIVTASVPSRTVPKDAYGYPIVKYGKDQQDPDGIAPTVDDDDVESF